MALFESERVGSSSSSSSQATWVAPKFRGGRWELSARSDQYLAAEEKEVESVEKD